MVARNCLLCFGCVLLLVGAGCSSASVASMPEEFPSMPAASSYEGIWVEGRFYTNHQEIFGQDLLAAGYVPIAIRIFTRPGSEAEGDARLLVEDIKPRLYLPDGAVLELIPYDRMEVQPYTEGRITEEALDVNIIKPEEQSKEGFIFFRLPLEAFRVVDHDTIVHLKSPLSQELKISKSLVSLEYFTDEGVRPVFVGLRMDRRLKRG